VNLAVMRLIDEEYPRHPFYGSRRMTAWLQRQGYAVNRKRIQRLMRLMGIAAISPKPRLRLAAKDHERFPYLLREVVVEYPDQVWCTDITYIICDLISF
jgi:putative transposase